MCALACAYIAANIFILISYVSSRLMNSARNSEKGLPVTVSASRKSPLRRKLHQLTTITDIDGLCLTLTPNSHNLNYRSAVLFGYATVVDNLEEKLYAMEVITNGIIPDRWRNTRTPPNAAEMQSTSILCVKVTTGSGKVRTGSADLDKKYDLDDEDLVKRVWTGVIPMYTTLGEPVPRGDNRVTELPKYLRDFMKESNGDAKTYAYDAINIEVPKKKQDDDD
jgi:nitroimidazol reductase NimA-like FMN-containing flavoprotein (pyridoxamine 5'-phosphate oxidase superfamily)